MYLHLHCILRFIPYILLHDDAFIPPSSPLAVRLEINQAFCKVVVVPTAAAGACFSIVPYLYMWCFDCITDNVLLHFAETHE